MEHLPPEFADQLAEVLEPAQRDAAAGIIKAATALDDDALRMFLDLFAQRVRESGELVTHAELQGFLEAARESRRARGL
jgi:hypothetical protein